MTLQIAIPESLPPTPRDYVGSYDDAGRDLLLRPGRVGPMEVSCRIVLPAMETNLGTKDGFVTQRLIDYYVERARGGVAWVTTENTSIHPSGLVTSGMLRIETDAQGRAFEPLAKAVHAAGSKLLIQLSHAGRQTLSHFVGGPPWAPSKIVCPMMKDMPRAMTDADVHTLIDAFVAGAVRAKQAGADGVELHMAHGYLLCGFLSPDQNHRDDAWGGDTERRCAFPCAVVRGIRDACGDDFAVIARISADEYVEGGIHPDEAVLIAQRLVAAGAHALHVSACNYESMFWNIPSYFLPEAPFTPLAARVRESVDVPVIAVGRVHRPEVAARVLAAGHADFVAMGRALIADPWIVRRVRERQPERIRPCLSCNRCIASITGSMLECTVNPDVGFEAMTATATTATPTATTATTTTTATWAGQRVCVVGGGVAGMAAALAALRVGASVRLIERRDQLGGQLDVAAMPPGKEPVAWYWAWLERELRAAIKADAGSSIQLGRDAAAADLAGADLLIWAGGSRPIERRFPGDDALVHVALDDAMRDPALAGARPVVVGAGAGGSEAAHWLAERGADVLLLELRRKIATDLIPNLRFHLERELEDAGVEVVTQAKNLRFEGQTARIDLRKRGTVDYPGRTAIVDATGRATSAVPATLTDGFQGEVVAFGDGAEPASIFEALTAVARYFRRA